MEPRQTSATLVRNFVFGVEDSLVSTVGLLSGIAVADMPRGMILVSGAVLIAVEALSMGAGSFLSETSAEKYLTQTEMPSRTSVAAGAVMFFSYLFAGFVPLAPYIVLPVEFAFWVAIAVSLASLFVLGAAGAKLSGTRVGRGGLRMLVIGGAALGVGVFVGQFFGV